MTINNTYNNNLGRKMCISSSRMRFSIALIFSAFLFVPQVSFGASEFAYLRDNTPHFVEKSQNTYGEMVNIASLLQDYDKNLIFAVIVVESEGNTIAVSHKGAQGLMQLMPGTAKALGVKDSKDPFQNILAGTRYLKELEGGYGFTDHKEALVAYNMGPVNAKRWLSQYDPEDSLYVRKVMYVYQYLQNKDANQAKSDLAKADMRPIPKPDDAPLAVFHILTKPQSLSLASFPMNVSNQKRNEVVADE